MTKQLVSNPDTCAICFEEFDENALDYNSKCTTICNHNFHQNCIVTWLDIKKNNVTCPYCRTSISTYLICEENTIRNTYYYTIRKNRKTLILDDINVSFIESQLRDQIPKAWLNFNENNAEIYRPIYTLSIKSNLVYITGYLRSYLLHTQNKSKSISLEKKMDLTGQIYYELNEDLPIIVKMKKYHYYTCYDWCYELLSEIKPKYDFIYYQFFNTLLVDLVIYTLNESYYFNTYYYFQGVFLCAIFLLIQNFKIGDNIPNIDDLNYYTSYSYNNEDLQKLIKIQEAYFKTQLSVF